MRREDVPGLLRSPRRTQLKTYPDAVRTRLHQVFRHAAVRRRASRRDGRGHSGARRQLGAGGAGSVDRDRMRRRGHRSNLVGSLPCTRGRPFRAIARGESRRAVDVARGLGLRRGPHFRAARRESPDDHRDRMVRCDVPNLFHRTASCAPSRRLLRDPVLDLPAGRRRDADVGDTDAAGACADTASRDS